MIIEFPTVEERIFRQSKLRPQKAALIDAASGEEISYGRLWEHILEAASAFHSHGFRRGDTIVLSASKSADFVYAYFGAHISGIIVAPVDSEINALRLQRIADSVKPKAIIGDVRHEIKGPEHFDFKSFLAKEGETSHVSPLFESSAIADILFTTGTTGAPKGVTLSFANEAAAANNINSFIGNTHEDVELLALPISHSFGLGRLRCMLSIGATVVILGSFASMKKFFGAMEKYGATGFGMVPASWAYISKMSGERIGNFATQLKYIEIGSAPLPKVEKEKLMRLLPRTEICMHYGLTEASRSTFLNFHREKDFLDSAGKASPNSEVAIFSEEGLLLPQGSEGEVCVRGLHVCSGYWNSPEGRYEEDFFDGFFRTGDWGFLDADGYLHLRSRKKEMINVGGKKVSPMEVEEALMSLNGVSEAACVGKPDPVMGEVVKAFIVGSIGPEDDMKVIGALSRILENYKVPAEIVHVQALPKTESGKIQRLKLKDLD